MQRRCLRSSARGRAGRILQSAASPSGEQDMLLKRQELSSQVPLFNRADGSRAGLRPPAHLSPATLPGAQGGAVPGCLRCGSPWRRFCWAAGGARGAGQEARRIVSARGGCCRRGAALPAWAGSSCLFLAIGPAGVRTSRNLEHLQEEEAGGP